MWTVYACGLNPQSFAATEAALVHNTYPLRQMSDRVDKMVLQIILYILPIDNAFGGKVSSSKEEGKQHLTCQASVVC